MAIPSVTPPPRGVDIEADVLFGIFHLEEEHLRDDSIGNKVVDRSADKYNTVAQQGCKCPRRALGTTLAFIDSG